MNFLNLKSIVAIVAAAVTAGTSTFLVQQREANRLRTENETLVAAQEKLTAERETALASAATVSQEMDPRQKEKNELLRLRNAVGQLRRQTAELRALLPVAHGHDVVKSQPLLTPEAGLGACLNNLRRIDAAIQMCALENQLSGTNVLTAEQVLPYLIEQQLPRCPSGGTYSLGRLSDLPSCSIPGHGLPIPEISPDHQASLDAMAVLRRAYELDNEDHPLQSWTELLEAYKQDHNGQAPKDPAELKPYQKPAGPRFLKAEEDYKRDHSGQASTNVTDLVPYLRLNLQPSSSSDGR